MRHDAAEGRVAHALEQRQVAQVGELDHAPDGSERRATSPPVDPERARQLLARERERIEQALAELGQPELDEPGDTDSETLYQNEFDATQAADLAPQLEAVERAEARLAAGTYGPFGRERRCPSRTPGSRCSPPRSARSRKRSAAVAGSRNRAGVYVAGE